MPWYVIWRTSNDPATGRQAGDIVTLQESAAATTPMRPGEAVRELPDTARAAFGVRADRVYTWDDVGRRVVARTTTINPS